MNPFCDDCGFRYEPAGIARTFRCRGCGRLRSEADIALDARPAPEPAHGHQCEYCTGLGYVLVDRVQYHPYGDTMVPEQWQEQEDCLACGGTGYEHDGTSCIACGKPVVAGALDRGWEVHEMCVGSFIPELRAKC